MHLCVQLVVPLICPCRSLSSSLLSAFHLSGLWRRHTGTLRETSGQDAPCPWWQLSCSSCAPPLSSLFAVLVSVPGFEPRALVFAVDLWPAGPRAEDERKTTTPQGTRTPRQRRGTHREEEEGGGGRGRAVPLRPCPPVRPTTVPWTASDSVCLRWDGFALLAAAQKGSGQQGDRQTRDVFRGGGGGGLPPPSLLGASTLPSP
jgi:hypothetical protein